jgi:phosphohistidine phosphatase
MKIYFMRHGDAAPAGGDIPEDSLRPLSPGGQVQVRRVAEGFKNRGLALTTVISSPLLRARETAQIMAGTLAEAAPQIAPALAPNASPAGVREIVESQARAGVTDLLCVGHHPDVTLWVAIIAGIDAGACPIFGTAAVAALELAPPQRKPRFLWYQTADQLSHS